MSKKATIGLGVAAAVSLVSAACRPLAPPPAPPVEKPKLELAQPVRQYHVARFAPDATPTIDGDLSDWAGVPDRYWVTQDEMVNKSRGGGTDKLRVAVGYCAETPRLYFAVRVEDNYLKVQRKTTQGMDPYFPFHDDIFEIVVDADCTGDDLVQFKHRKGKASRPLVSCHAQNYHVYLIGPAGPEHNWLWGDQQWICRRPYAAFAHRMTGTLGGPGTVALEFMVTPFNYADRRGPQHSAVAPLAPGEPIGLGWLRLDEDGGEPRRHDEGDDYYLGYDITLYRDADMLYEMILDRTPIRANAPATQGG